MTIKVHLLDIERLNKDISEQIANGKEYQVGYKWGIIFGEHLAVTMEECVFFAPKDKQDKVIHFDLYEVPKDKNSFAIIPSYRTNFSIEELEEYMTCEFTTLREFMGDRFDYNSRIRANTEGLIRYLDR